MQDDEKGSLGILWWLLIGICFIVVPLFLFGWYNGRTAGRVAQATAEVLMYQMAITNFQATVGRWPASLRELETNSVNLCFVMRPDPADPWSDPWSNPYVFVPYHSATGFGRILTLGRDHKPGGTGLDADIERRFP